MTPQASTVAKLLAVFGEPRTENPAVYLTEFTKAISCYPGDILELACNDVIRTCTFFPRPAEIVQRAEEAMALRRKPGPYKPSEPVPPPLSPEQRAELAKIMSLFKADMSEADKDSAFQRPDWRRGQKPQFEAMMKNSPNRELYEKHAEITRRITGERE